jgi:Fe-S-cluster containining protein
MEECKLSGVCCRLFFINLTEEEYKSKKFKTQFEEFGFVEDFDEAQEYGANVLSKKEDGSCVYLKENKCSIHSIRPNACRDFFCTSPEPRFSEMVAMVAEEKAKLGLTEDH